MTPVAQQLPEPNTPVRVWIVDRENLRASGEWHGQHDGTRWLLSPGLKLGNATVEYWEYIPGARIARSGL